MTGATRDATSAQPSSLVVAGTRDGQVTLTLNHATRGNALGPAITEALTQQVLLHSTRPEVHTLALVGTGANFCTGFDWSDTETASDGDLLLRFVRIELLLQALWTAPVRTVACVQGRAWGAGADIVAACDVRIAASDSTFRFPGAGFGIVLGTRRLAERIGSAQARSAVLSGREIGAAEALDLGLVTAMSEGPMEDVASTLPAIRVDKETLAGIARATRLPMDDADLASLVRSAARPGLAGRLREYRERMRPKKTG